MTVVLPTETVSLYGPGTADEHGWVSGPSPAGDQPVWTGSGAVQLGPGLTRVRASEDGGAGPFDPAATSSGEAYLPEDCPAADGMVLVARGTAYVLSQTRWVVDPSGGPLGCVVTSLSQVDQWPA